MQVNENLVEKFIKSADWESIWNNDTFCQEDTYAIESNLDEDTFNWESGATKMVILPVDPNEQFVIKIPFRFLYDECGYYEEEDDDSAYYHEFTRAPRPKDGMIGHDFYRCDWDYCETEIEYCELAKAANIGEFFPETKKYCEVPYPVYVQELCELACYKPIEDFEKRNAIYEQIKAQTQSDEVAKYCREFMTSWILAAVQTYGLEKLIELFKFMAKYNMSDFHSANYGYRKSDGTPVLIDFAGFYEE